MVILKHLNYAKHPQSMNHDCIFYHQIISMEIRCANTNTTDYDIYNIE